MKLVFSYSIVYHRARYATQAAVTTHQESEATEARQGMVTANEYSPVYMND